MFFVTCEWTCASKVDYSGEGRTSTASIGTGAQECFPMFSACFLFSVKRQVPAISSTAVKGAQVHLMQQEEYMSVKRQVFLRNHQRKATTISRGR